LAPVESTVSAIPNTSAAVQARSSPPFPLLSTFSPHGGKSPIPTEKDVPPSASSRAPLPCSFPGMPPLGSTPSSSLYGSLIGAGGESAAVSSASLSTSVPHPPPSSSPTRSFPHIPVLFPPFSTLSGTYDSLSDSNSGVPKGGSLLAPHQNPYPQPQPQNLGPASDFPNAAHSPLDSTTTAKPAGSLPPSSLSFIGSPSFSASTSEETPMTEFVHISRTVPLYICVMDGIYRRLGLRKITGAQVQQALRLAHLPDEDLFWECHVNDFTILVQALIHVVQQQQLTSPPLSATMISGASPMWGGASSWHLGSTSSSSIAGVTGGGVHGDSSDSSTTIHAGKRASGTNLSSPFLGVS